MQGACICGYNVKLYLSVVYDRVIQKSFLDIVDLPVIEDSKIQVLCILYLMAKTDLILVIISGNLSLLLFPSLLGLFIVCMYFVFLGTFFFLLFFLVF